LVVRQRTVVLYFCSFISFLFRYDVGAFRCLHGACRGWPAQALARSWVQPVAYFFMFSICRRCWPRTTATCPFWCFRSMYFRCLLNLVFTAVVTGLAELDASRGSLQLCAMLSHSVLTVVAGTITTCLSNVGAFRRSSDACRAWA